MPLHRFPAIATLAVALGLSASGRVHAESYHTCTGFIDSLPAVIGTQGTWCLRGDLSTAMTSGPAITIAVNNVTIDCNGFKIGGLAAGAGTIATGRISLVDNFVIGSGIAASIGVLCTSAGGRARDNHILGFASPIVDCTDDGNTD